MTAEQLSRSLLVERFTAQPEPTSDHRDDTATCAARCRVLMEALEQFEGRG